MSGPNHDFFVADAEPGHGQPGFTRLAKLLRGLGKHPAVTQIRQPNTAIVQQTSPLISLLPGLVLLRFYGLNAKSSPPQSCVDSDHMAHSRIDNVHQKSPPSTYKISFSCRALNAEGYAIPKTLLHSGD